MPSLPCTRSLMKCQYCRYNGAFRPCCTRNAASWAGVAALPSTARAGSPGMADVSRKTSMLMISRLSTSLPIISAAPRLLLGPL